MLPRATGGGGPARRPLRGGKQKESREQMLQILLSAGGPVWSEEQRIEVARSWGETEVGAPSPALGLSRMRERKELAHWRQYRGGDGCPTFNFNHGGSVPSTCAGRTAGLTASGRAGAEEERARTREPSPASSAPLTVLYRDRRTEEVKRREGRGEEGAPLLGESGTWADTDGGS